MTVTVTNRKSEATFHWNYKGIDLTYRLIQEYNGGKGALVPVLPFEVIIDYPRLRDLMVEEMGKYVFRIKSADREQLLVDLKRVGPYSLVIDA